MMTVRYPNGQAITYNNANSLSCEEGEWNLYKDYKKKQWVCSIQPSAGVIVECYEPCKIENPMLNLTEEKAIQLVADILDDKKKRLELSGESLKKIKRALTKYNAKIFCWE